ncbi:MAG: 3-hydroxy-3-methylglutaryl coenzyme A reductase [Planctomycetota bacterium]|nr:MAG: 3-hydroxy-3-methylglutaryl coenzyme A reductase [Planctomycetota bacterium]
MSERRLMVEERRSHGVGGPGPAAAPAPALAPARPAAATSGVPEQAGQPPKFYHLSIEERIALLRAETGLDEQVLAALGRADPLPLEVADRLIENVVGLLPLPLGIARHFLIDGREVPVPLAIEEPSVVAAASFGAKLLRAGGGIETSATEPLMLGQVLLLEVRELEQGTQRLAARRAEILAAANARHPRLVAAGGGARGFATRVLRAQPQGAMVVFELEVDVRDAMGANIVNSMCEAVAPLVADCLGGRVGMRILTNLCDRRLARARGRVPRAVLGAAGVRGVHEASLFAELDPYRAATHNKGVMNGIDALLIATGQDWRAAEAGAHAYAARSGRYAPLATWREDQQTGDLLGEIEVPLALGTVGGRARVHPSVVAARALVGAGSAQELARIAAAVGLAQNLAALRALAQEGIQRGHMRLHRRGCESR